MRRRSRYLRNIKDMSAEFLVERGLCAFNRGQIPKFRSLSLR